MQDTINTNRFVLNLDSEDIVTILKALYWHEDKLANQQHSTGRDNAEWDRVVYIRSWLGKLLKQTAYID